MKKKHQSRSAERNVRSDFLLTLGRKNQRKLRPASQDGSPRIMLASRAQKALKEKKRILFNADSAIMSRSFSQGNSAPFDE
jgi:hypothetical protein